MYYYNNNNNNNDNDKNNGDDDGDDDHFTVCFREMKSNRLKTVQLQSSLVGFFLFPVGDFFSFHLFLFFFKMILSRV